MQTPTVTYTQKELEKATNKAKLGLITKGSVFLSTITFNLKLIFTDELPTAGVDGINLYINPSFFMSSSEEERIFVIAHEAWHVAFNHLLRRGNRNPEIYNHAGDYVINQLLHDEGYKMYSWVLRDDKYKNMSTEQVYNLLIKDPNKLPNNPMGGDIKPPTDPDNKIRVDAEVKRILANAITASKMANEAAGKIPGDIRRVIDELLNPVVPWNNILDRYFTSMSKEDYTWKRPNKRFLPTYYLPSQHSETLGNITIAIDTSGSITKDQLVKILSEIKAIQAKYTPDSITLIDCDKKIHNIHDVKPHTDLMKLKFTGGGGTSFDPVIQYCNKHKPTVLLYFTDLYANPLKELPKFPVIWVCYSNHPPAKTGETIYYT